MTRSFRVVKCRKEIKWRTCPRLRAWSMILYAWLALDQGGDRLQ
jgi:hypothetical protein